MEVEMNEHVQAVAEFMQRKVPCANLVATAQAVAGLAPSLWGHFQPADHTIPLMLREPAPVGSAAE